MNPAAFPAPGTFIELPGGLPMPYIERGKGELLLFVHGSLCDYRYWRPQLAGLAQQYRCVCVSLTHYWPAGDAARGQPFSWRRHVDELAAFVDGLGAGPAHVIGHSRGGRVSFEFARRHPWHVRTLTLADPGGPVQQPGQTLAVLPENVNALRARAVALIESGQMDAGLELFVDSVSRPGFWAKSTHAFRRMATDNAHTLGPQFQDPLSAYTREEAAEVRCPVLLIDGELSPEVFHRAVAALDAWLPDARRASVARASHGMNLARPAAFNELIDRFVSGRGR
ncbi:Pimeloyl-ACP methyl ester carboxylesterase [Paraburkholderia lycopersici]|uniref:Pimeloyl-ACP methyl ester carboxylesterase n=2 Tax=Paraburkholderia lycopersici TaxID=416944 RepID=A0A1G7DF95_9BURK|nr:Pimeloyl-ACP methyl ester carboxylesterase [Paraburkholderia lycopersici]